MIPVLVMALAAQTPWGRIDPPPGLECVSKGSDALVLQPELFLSAPHVRKLSVSPTGTYAIVTSTDEKDEPLWESPTRVELLNVGTRNLMTLRDFDAKDADHVQIEWASATRAYAMVTRTIARPATILHDVVEIDATQGSWKIIGQSSDQETGPFPELYVSPQGKVVLFGQKVEFGNGGLPTTEQFVFRSIDGSELGAPLTFNRETSGPAGAEWSADGRLLKLKVQRGDPVRGQTRPEFAIFDVALQSLAYESRGADAEPVEPDFALVRRRPTVEANRWPHTVDTLWLEAAMPADEPSAFVCAEPEAWALSPKLDYILYTSKGALWMRTLKKMRVSDVRELQIKAIQDRAMAQAQRMGRAVVLYWRDNGQVYPAKTDFRTAIRAYNEDDDAIERFVPTFGGGPARVGVNTETTPVGYFDVKIGRAYVMLDGRTRWEFNPKSN
jgi:hypothetical protein